MSLGISSFIFIGFYMYWILECLFILGRNGWGGLEWGMGWENMLAAGVFIGKLFPCFGFRFVCLHFALFWEEIKGFSEYSKDFSIIILLFLVEAEVLRNSFELFIKI